MNLLLSYVNAYDKTVPGPGTVSSGGELLIKTPFHENTVHVSASLLYDGYFYASLTS